MNATLRNFLTANYPLITKLLLVLCFVYHLFFFYFNNVLNKDQMEDSIIFYKSAMHISSIGEWLENFKMGGYFFIFLVTPIIKLSKSFLFVSLLLSLLSFIPYYYVIKNREKFTSFDSIFTTITFLFFLFFPSVHVWTTTISKEALLFVLMFFVLLWSYFHTNIIFSKVLFIILVIAIRPHLGVFLVISVLLLSWNKFSFKLKILYIAGIIFTGILAIYFVSIGFSNLNVFERLAAFEAYSYSGTYIDIKENPYFYRIISLLFRPFIWETKSIFQFLYSIENVFFFIWIMWFLYYCISKKLLKKVSNNIFIVNSVLLILFISIYIFNLGLASRMKVMFMPFLFFGALLLFNQRKNAKIS